MRFTFYQNNSKMTSSPSGSKYKSKKQASRQRTPTYKQSMGINLHSLGRIRFGALHLPHFRNSSLTLWSHKFVQPILVFLTQDPIGCNHYWIWLPGSALRRWYWAGTYGDVILLPRFCHSLRGVNLEPVTTMGPNLSMGASRNECAHQFPADSVHVVSFEKLTVLLFRPDSDEDVIYSLTFGRREWDLGRENECTKQRGRDGNDDHGWWPKLWPYFNRSLIVDDVSFFKKDWW